MRFILASTSPRRHQLFTLLGWNFKVQKASVDESPGVNEKPREYVTRVSEAKAHAIACLKQRNDPEAIIIAADTTVVDNGEILGKPSSESEAERMLIQLRGREHSVLTALTIWRLSDDLVLSDLSETRVSMRNYTNEEIRDYISSGDPLDKAGGYAIQHKGFNPVENLKECFANVVGFPLCHLTRALSGIGIKSEVDLPELCLDIFEYNCKISEKILSGEHND